MTEQSTVLVIERFDMDAANDNGATRRKPRWLQRLPAISPAVAFWAGFAAAGVLVAAETLLRISG